VVRDAMSVRELTDDEIHEEVSQAKEELARLRYRAAFEDLENPSLLRTLRRDIARLKTVERERAAVEGERHDTGEGNDV
jgi:large subunit ribosomal protein L29